MLRPVLWAMLFFAAIANAQLLELPANVDDWGPYNDAPVVMHAGELLAIPGERPQREVTMP